MKYKNYIIKINGEYIKNFNKASLILGIKEQTLYRRVSRNNGKLLSFINNYIVEVYSV